LAKCHTKRELPAINCLINPDGRKGSLISKYSLRTLTELWSLQFSEQNWLITEYMLKSFLDMGKKALMRSTLMKRD